MKKNNLLLSKLKYSSPLPNMVMPSLFTKYQLNAWEKYMLNAEEFK